MIQHANDDANQGSEEENGKGMVNELTEENPSFETSALDVLFSCSTGRLFSVAAFDAVVLRFLQHPAPIPHAAHL